ncbi:hypothetical protein FACS189443_1960 [Planctomycetales bacterium]|nr:hypothetical protein FACS189443_1960 [Planctomycetales bacterium]
MSTEKAQEVINTAVQNQPEPPRYWRNSGCRTYLTGCLKICLLAALVLAVPFWWFCLHTTPLRFSKETTYITEPKTSDGKRIDYFRALEERYYPPEMKTDDNGYRIFIRGCGTLHEISYYDPPNESNESFRLQTYEKLGLDSNIKPAMKIEEPNKFIRRTTKDNPEYKDAKDIVEVWNRHTEHSTPWTFKDFPVLKNWLDENTAGIDLLGEAVRKPVFRAPLVRENENVSLIAILLPQIRGIRELSRAVNGRALYRIGIGDIDGAIDDKITLYRLGRYAGQSPFLIGGLVGFAIEGMGAAIGIDANPDFPATKEQIERLMREIDALPPRITFAECIETERYCGLGTIQDLFRRDIPSKHATSLDIIGLFPSLSWSVDSNILLVQFNKAYDEMIAGTFDEASFRSFRPSRNPFRYMTVRSRTERMGDVLLRLLVPAVNGFNKALNRNECADNMQRITLALLLYEMEHGKLPDGDWQTAIKSYLGKDADKYFHCPSDTQTAYALVSNGGDLLLVETERSKPQPEGSVTIPNDPSLFKGKHPHVYNAGYRNGAVRSISETKKDK